MNQDIVETPNQQQRGTDPQNQQKETDPPNGQKHIPEQLMSVSKIYTNVNHDRTQAYFDYEQFDIKWRKTDGYEIVTKIGRGKYSEVFEGLDCREPENERKIIIKVLKPVRPGKIKREVKILTNLKGGPSIVKLLDMCKAGTEHNSFMALIFEHIEHENVKDLMLRFEPIDCKVYMYQLLKALDFCHANGIMHRDVKPQNLVIDHRNKQLRLIDWGLADFYHPGHTYNVRVASRHYKSPELLVKMQMYDYSVDLFAFGCTVLGIVTGKIPFFRGKDNVDQLFKIADVLGTIELKKYLGKYNLRLSNKHFTPLLQKDTPRFCSLRKESRRLTWSKYIPSRRKNFIQDSLCELLDGVLMYDHQHRLTAKECMNHTYFAEVRDNLGLHY